MKRTALISISFALAGASAVLAQGQYGAQTSVTVPLTPKAPALADAVPDAHGIRRMVILRGLDKVTGRATEIAAPVGVPVRFGTLEITARYCYTVPPEEPPETTAFLQIDDTKGETRKRMFSGWMFASTPALNGLEHAVYDVWVITCKTDQPATAAPPSAPPGGTEAAAPVLEKEPPPTALSR